MSGTLPACRSSMKNDVCGCGGRLRFCVSLTHTHAEREREAETHLRLVSTKNVA